MRGYGHGSLDRLSKMVRLHSVKTIIGAKHGLPASMVSCRDPRFTSEFFTELCEQLGVKQYMSTALRPQFDKQTKRMNRTLLQVCNE